MKNALALQDVTKEYGEVCVLSHLNYTFEAGKMYALSGESGVGKSTLAQIAAGLDTEYRGAVTWNGENLIEQNDAWVSEFRKNVLGIQFQSNALVPTLTAYDNVALPLILCGNSVAESQTQARRLLERLELAEAVNKKLNKLSGGEKKRVAIACAIIRNPVLLVLDEPTGNLDARHEALVLELLKEYQATAGACIIIATHSSAVVRAADVPLYLRRTRQGGRLYEE